MNTYTPVGNTFNDSINVFDTTDRAHADVLNTPVKQLAENVEYLKKNTTGGSLITVETGDEEMYGATVTLSKGGSSVEGTINNQGVCVFKGVQLTGTLTVTATKDGETVTETLSVPYYASYEVDLGESLYTLNISTTEASLYEQPITITNGTKSKVIAFDDEGSASTKISFDGSVTISATDGEEVADKTITVSSGTTTYNVALKFAKYYGAVWDGSSSSAFTRTGLAEDFTDPVAAVNNGNGSSPFDSIAPWKDLKVIDNATAGKLVEIPKFWYRIIKNGTSLEIQIANEALEGFSISPAHQDRGDGKGVRDKVYVGRYHCASDYKSKTGVTPANNFTRAELRSNIHNLGTDFWQYDFAMYWTIMLLYLVEYANWNSQKVIGYGCGNNSAVENMGATDAMTYHTGTNAASRDAYGHVQYRHIEGLWDNVFDWCDGIYFAGTDNKDVYLITKPSDFSDSTGGTKIAERPTTGNCIKAWTVPAVSGKDWAMYPAEVVSDSTYQTYVCDHCNYNASGVVLFVGGSYGQSQNRGAFYLSGYYQATNKDGGIGSRLQYLP